MSDSISPGHDIKDFLDAYGDLGVITVGYMGPSPDEMATIHEYGSFPPEGQFGVLGVKYERPTIQLVFRGQPNDYSGPMRKARIAWQALAEIQPGALGSTGIEYLMVKPQQSPFSIGRDANNRFEIVCNYLVTKEPF